MTRSDISNAYSLKPLKVKPGQLLLDPSNPRIVLNTQKQVDFEPQKLADPKVQEWILSVVDKSEYHVKELIRGIARDGFLNQGNSIIVERVDGTNQYLVIEGNRRTTAIRHLLSDAENLKPHVLRSLERIPVQELLIKDKNEFDREQVVLKLLGLIHLTGPLGWGAMERAYYIYRSYLSELQDRGFKGRFAYSRNCARNVSEFYNVSVKKVRKELITYRVYETLRDRAYDVDTRHYTLIELAVTTRGLNEAFFELDDEKFTFSPEGLERFGDLCLGKDPVINNPKEFRAFTKVALSGTENDLQLVMSKTEPVLRVYERLLQREDRHAFVRSLQDIRDQLASLSVTDSRGTNGEADVIAEIKQIVDKKLWPLAQ